MNYKQRMVTIDLLDILQKFIVAYCFITVMLSLIDSTTITYSLRLLPVPFLSYVIQSRTKHIWSFVLLHTAILPLYILTSSGMIIIMFFCSYIVITAVRSYLTKGKGSMKNNFFLTAVFLFLYIILSTSNLQDLMQFTFRMAILYILLCIIGLYLLNFSNYLNNHAAMVNVPYQQIKTSNNILILILGGLFLATLLTSYGLPLTNLIKAAMKAIVGFLIFLISLFRSEEPEVADPDSRELQEEAIPVDLTPSPLLQVLEKIIIVLIIIGMVLFISFIVYKLYLYYYKKKETATYDKVEFLTPFTKKHILRGKKRSVNIRLFGHSNNAAIRKQYYKAVASSIGENASLRPNLTPTELTDLMKLDNSSDTMVASEQKRLITEYYEKARYSNEECRKEEVKSFKELLK